MVEKKKFDEIRERINQSKYIDPVLWHKAAEDMLNLSKKEKCKTEQAEAYQELANNQLFCGNLEEAIQNTKRSIRIAKQNYCVREEGISYGMLALIYTKQNNEVAAIDYFHHAIDCMKSCKDNKSLSSIYSNMAMLFFNVAEYKKALYCEETSDFFRRADTNEKEEIESESIHKLITIINKAFIYEKLDRVIDAYDYIDSIDSMENEVTKNSMRQYIYAVKAKLAYKTNEMETFFGMTALLLNYSGYIEYNLELLEDYFDIFDDLIASGEYMFAEKMIDLIEKTAKKAESNSVMISVYRRKMKLLKLLNNQEAIEKFIPEYCEALLQRNDELFHVKQANLLSFIELEKEMDIQEEYQLEIRELEQRSSYDALTGLASRVYLNIYIENMFHMLHVSDNMLAIAIIDVDHFKDYNDAYGHIIGDYYLSQVAKTIKHCAGDLFCARYGGDEFFIVAPEKSADELVGLSKSIQEKLKKINISGKDGQKGITLTVSVGICADIPGNTILSATEFMHNADNALYEAKGAGRNRISVYKCL